VTLLPSGPTAVDETPAQVRLTDPGRRHPVTELASSAAQNETLWTALPRLPGLNTTGPLKGGAQTLLQSPEGRPVLVVGEAGRGRVLALLSDSSWFWSFVAAGASRARARTRPLALRHPLAGARSGADPDARHRRASVVRAWRRTSGAGRAGPRQRLRGCGWSADRGRDLFRDRPGSPSHRRRDADEMKQDQYERTLRARAFDISRYMLPLATNTSLGQIVNARTLETQISRLLSNPVPRSPYPRRSTERRRANPSVNINQEKWAGLVAEVRALNADLESAPHSHF